MLAILFHTLRQLRGAMLGWGLSLTLMPILSISLFDTLASQGENLDKLMATYPPEMALLFGEISSIGTPVGFLGLEFFGFMPFILGIFAVIAGAGAVIADEEAGMLDLLLANPLSRTTLFVGRTLGMFLALAAILGMSLLGMTFAQTLSQEMNLAFGQLLRAFFPLYVQVSLFAALALALSMILPGRSLAAMSSGLILAASYFANAMADVNNSLESVAKFSPIYYYPSSQALVEKLDWTPLSILIALTIALVGLAWWRFQQRDLRVSGESIWRLRIPFRGAKTNEGGL